MKRKTTEQFIIESKTIHGTKYNYDCVDYKNGNEKVKIICPEHGDFFIRGSKHLLGGGCPKCSKRYKPSTAEFIEKAGSIHKNKYSYINTIYLNNKTHVTVTCPKHGNFLVTPANHIYNSVGCRDCAKDAQRHQCIRHDTAWFISAAEAIHGTMYDYSKVSYHRYHDKVEIGCSKHGSFFQNASAHITNGSGCPKCANEISPGGYNAKFFDNNPDRKNLPAKLYVIEMWNNNERFLKFGITTKTLRDRFEVDNKLPYQYAMIEIKEESLWNVFNLEQQIKEAFIEHKYAPRMSFNGHTECVQYAAKELILKELK